MIDCDNVIKLNESNEKNEVYNYHMIGRGLWINKLVLPTTFEDQQSEVNELFEAAKIDFSKYSLEDAENLLNF